MAEIIDLTGYFDSIRSFNLTRNNALCLQAALGHTLPKLRDESPYKAVRRRVQGLIDVHAANSSTGSD